MKLFDVYQLFDVTPVSAKGCYITDEKGTEYLDLYGGHAVISVGHSHPYYINKITEQINRIGFYSNSVKNPHQEKLAFKLGELSGYEDYSLFLCNSGAEANENALKLASFHTGKRRILYFDKAFHGRTSAAVAVTDNPKIISPLNDTVERTLLPLNDAESLDSVLQKGDVAAVIVEGIQGIGGCRVPDPSFLEAAGRLCEKWGAVLILDEIQSGYGRSGKFFAHQYSKVKPDVISVAKGMGNGFPVGGILISPKFTPWSGMLGTTFGGNYLACAAGIAVLDIMKKEELTKNAYKVGNYLLEKVLGIQGIKEVRGRGLMIGLEFDFAISEVRKRLLFEEKIFTGVTGTNTIRILPPLTLTIDQADRFIKALAKVLN